MKHLFIAVWLSASGIAYAQNISSIENRDFLEANDSCSFPSVDASTQFNACQTVLSLNGALNKKGVCHAPESYIGRDWVSCKELGTPSQGERLSLDTETIGLVVHPRSDVVVECKTAETLRGILPSIHNISRSSEMETALEGYNCGFASTGSTMKILGYGNHMVHVEILLDGTDHPSPIMAWLQVNDLASGPAH
ncbi:hypothetical protein [Gluconobacter morbifer]|uniref:hypothetical protein n=1 Tax=Gluconobacter morbifer TaxID=479935 RepID=UPI00111260DB|nr:hypothetical protein [Gluconobacter morbifer]